MPLNETTNTTVQYTVTTTNTADGTTLYWKTTGNTTNSDIVGGNTGSITITNNQAVFNVSMNTDASLDGTKTLGIAIATGSQSGPTVVTTPAPIVVLDTSIPPVQVPLTFLAVAGGGGGSFYRAATTRGGSGGGAGGYITNTVNVLNSNVYTITVGAGGAGGWESFAAKGANSSISGIQLSNTAFGGGPAAGPDYNTSGTPPHGSGGGSSSPGYQSTHTAGQGNPGGLSYGAYYGGGGGGAGAAGQGDGGGVFGTGGLGGIGLQNSITGTSTYYAGGGSGGGYPGGYPGAIARPGGGGAGGNDQGSAASQFGVGRGQDGTTNLGGGGGGGTSATGGTGGSGIVILSVPTIYYSGTYTGSNVAVTTSGANTVLSFYSSGTYTS